jgi:hypothetical protein
MLISINVWRPVELNDLELCCGIGVIEPYPHYCQEEYQLYLVQESDGDDKDNREFFDWFSLLGLITSIYAELWHELLHLNVKGLEH